MTELDKLLRSTEAMTELDRLLREIEGRADAANPWDGAAAYGRAGFVVAAARIAADVPKLVKALRRAMKAAEKCSDPKCTFCGKLETDLTAILKEKP